MRRAQILLYYCTNITGNLNVGQQASKHLLSLHLKRQWILIASPGCRPNAHSYTCLTKSTYWLFHTCQAYNINYWWIYVTLHKLFISITLFIKILLRRTACRGVCALHVFVLLDVSVGSQSSKTQAEQQSICCAVQRTLHWRSRIATRQIRDTT